MGTKAKSGGAGAVGGGKGANDKKAGGNGSGGQTSVNETFNKHYNKELKVSEGK